jgi:hypothetical protein
MTEPPEPKPPNQGAARPAPEKPGRDAARNTSAALPDRVRGILLTRNLTMYKISVLTRARYPSESSYHIPRNLYFQLRSAGWSPTLHQMFALSQISGYRLADWLAVFGFPLGEIARLQTALPHPRTALLDGFIYDAGAKIPWFQERSPEGPPPPVAPLSQLLESAGGRSIASLASPDPGQYVYAKIGQQDAFTFPDLLPGSIVRANPRLLERLSPTSHGEISKHIFLVEHARGLCCCRLHFGTKNRVTLTATQLPFANVELQLGPEATILGILDLEIRPLMSRRRGAPCGLPEVAPELARLWTPASLKSELGSQRAARLLRDARRRAGLSLRLASEMSRSVATALQDPRYFTSPGALSDMEARDTPPRHIHKLFTVCILYSVRFADLLKVFGLSLDDSASVAIPDEWTDRGGEPIRNRETTRHEKSIRNGFLATLRRRFGDVPFFLCGSLASLSGLPEISLRDVFWVGGQRRAMHPSLVGALFVIVDRRKRKPRMFPRNSAWEQLLYLLRKRDGSYVLASCALEDDTIIVHPYTEGFVRPERLRNQVDAEVVGQVVTVVRSIPSPP